MEPLAVKEVKGNWLLVYSLVFKNGFNIEKHKERGWINVSNLVLSSYSVLNEKGTPKKGMALISLDNTKQAFAKDGFERYKFFNSPDLRTLKEESRKFEIYYIFKENKGTKLLSRTDKLNQGTQEELQNKVGGWMSNFNITSWDHRVCLEVASSDNANREYSAMNIPVYPSEDKLNNFVASGLDDTEGSIMKFKISPQNPPNPYIMRMPILSNIDAKSKQVATVGTLKDNTSTLIETAKLRQKIQIANNKLENINILFVIDGTQSMSPYYKTVAKSITEIIENNKLSRANNKLRFGAVIYRDYADGEQSCDVEPLTSDHKLIIKKLLTTHCGGVDLDLPEAQYNGLTEGIRRAGFNKDQSNIIVLIGDAGNHQPDPRGKSKEQVIKLMKSYEASLITFQVFYGGDQTFSDFNQDAKYYLRETGKLFSENNNVDVRLNPVGNIKNTYKLIYNDRTTNKPIDLYMFGRFTYASNTEPMSTKILEKNIIGSVFEYLEWVTKIINEAEKIGSGSGAGGTKYDETVKKYICEKFELSDAECKLLFEKVEEFSFIGYTNTRFYEKQTDCFIPVVFLSATEFDKISKALNVLKSGDLSTTEKSFSKLTT
jgi:Mg-chelatase subunit ChlD